MANGVDPDETAHYEPSHQDLYCLQKKNVLVCRGERVNIIVEKISRLHGERIFCRNISNRFSSTPIR